jgi:hypothetical protein
MTGAPQPRAVRLGDRLLTWLTILLVILTFVIVPLHPSGLIVAQAASRSFWLWRAHTLETRKRLRGYSYAERAIGLFVPGLVDDEHANDNYRLEKLPIERDFHRSVSDLSDFGSIFHAH